jgi:hypothetical protein
MLLAVDHDNAQFIRLPLDGCSCPSMGPSLNTAVPTASLSRDWDIHYRISEDSFRRNGGAPVRRLRATDFERLTPCGRQTWVASRPAGRSVPS